MRRKKRKERVARGYSEAQRAEMWERWSRGESLKAIGRIFGKEGGSVFGQLAVEPQEVVHGNQESGERGKVVEAGVGAMPVVMVEPG